MNDLAMATCARSGNLYGLIVYFALRDGDLYEVSGYRDGYLYREFVTIEEGEQVSLTREAALEWILKKDV